MIHISANNSKLAIPSFSIPSKITCETGLACWSYCYAAKIEKLRLNVRKLYAENLLESKKETFVDDMVTKIRNEFNPRYFRVHVGGDFVSKEYGEKWMEIAKRLKDTIFYTYTKREFMKDVARPKNFILYWSMDGVKSKTEIKANTAHNEELRKSFDGVSYTSSDFTNCPNMLDDTIKCGGACSKCMKPSKSPIIFHKH